jgi:hypothetical protein
MQPARAVDHDSFAFDFDRNAGRLHRLGQTAVKRRIGNDCPKGLSWHVGFADKISVALDLQSREILVEPIERAC